jgi:hypothetical protein
MFAGPILVGAAAGIVSALLFAVISTGSPLAVVLSYVAPLPILIASLGWNHRAGLIASAIGAGVLMAAFSPATSAVFALGLALPAWWVAYLALLGRPDAAGVIEWYPLGNILAWIGIAAALVTLIGVFTVGSSYAEYDERLRRLVTGVIRAGGTPRMNMPADAPEAAIIDAVVAAAPVLTAASLVPMQAANLWLAAKAVAMSGRLPRPWPMIADAAMPVWTVPALVLGAALGWFGEGYAGLASRVIAGAFGGAFALQGLATIHRITRGQSLRGAILTGLYTLIVLLLIWMAPLLACIGVIDRLVNARPKAGATPPAT